VTRSEKDKDPATREEDEELDEPMEDASEARRVEGGERAAAGVGEEEREEDEDGRTRVAVETLMRRYGDQLLQVFHANNLTFTSVDWQTIFAQILATTSNEGEGMGQGRDNTDFLRMLMNMSNDIERAMEYCEEGRDLGHLEEYLDQQDPETSLFSSIGRKAVKEGGRIGERVVHVIVPAGGGEGQSRTTTTTRGTN
jgi:hypothetical protein